MGWKWWIVDPRASRATEAHVYCTSDTLLDTSPGTPARAYARTDARTHAHTHTHCKRPQQQQKQSPAVLTYFFNPNPGTGSWVSVAHPRLLLPLFHRSAALGSCAAAADLHTYIHTYIRLHTHRHHHRHGHHKHTATQRHTTSKR